MEQFPYALAELNKESRMGAMGSENNAREVRRIDLAEVRSAPMTLNRLS